VLLGTVIVALGMVMLGPDTAISGLPHKIYIPFIAQCVLGCGASFMYGVAVTVRILELYTTLS
jgi:hypothetical protein